MSARTPQMPLSDMEGSEIIEDSEGAYAVLCLLYTSDAADDYSV